MTHQEKKSNTLLSASIITIVASLVILSVYIFRKSDKLSFVDFNPAGSNNVEFCDPNHPRVIAVDNKVPRFTVTNLRVEHNSQTQSLHVTFTLVSATNKLITAPELSSKNPANFQLILASPSLNDIQLIEPNYDPQKNIWSFNFIPTSDGNYSLFADLIPEATQAEIYSLAHTFIPHTTSVISSHLEHDKNLTAELIKPSTRLYTGQAYELSVQLSDTGNKPLLVIPYLGSFAHLVIIDKSQSSFINARVDPLHIDHSIDLKAPTFFFNLLIPDPGSYTVCLAVNISGKMNYFTFPLTIEP